MKNIAEPITVTILILFGSASNVGVFVENLLDRYLVDAIVEALSTDTEFEDGRLTAGITAQEVKNNIQAKTNESVAGAIKMIEQAMLKNPIVRSATYPDKIAKLMFNRYDEGMAYGAHVDDAFINSARTDLSFTLFLSEPESYEGGELILQRDDGDESIKLARGALYIYPSNSIHRVAPVTQGHRLAAVGWIQSRVKSDERRQILFDLSQALINLPKTEENTAARLRFLNAKNNLLRLWSD